VTNPPYNLAEQFVRKAIGLADNKVAMFLRLNFLEGQKRYKLFRQYPPRMVYVFSKRQTLYPLELGIPSNGGTIAYAWFVWYKGFQGKPEIDWIDD